jgi:ADP-ribose pyrophosphatase
VTRWLRDDAGNVVHDGQGFPVLEVVVVTRNSDAGYGEYALPGGMVDPGEAVTATIKREFGEEALNSQDMSPDEKEKMRDNLNKLMSNGIVLYQGSTNDPRQTDNAWIETIAMNFHDVGGHALNILKLKAGSDAATVQLIQITPSLLKELKMFANHKDIVKTAYNLQLHLGRCSGELPH